MIKKENTFKGQDGREIFYRSWLPENAGVLKAAVQISHGLAEHSARYEDFAENLVKAGFAVYAGDHRGHGMTAGNIENLGHFSDTRGWETVVADMRSLTEIIKNNHPGLPIFLFGHSMGSFLSRDYIFTYPGNIRGVILSGTAADPGLPGYAGIAIAGLQCLIRGRRTKSLLIDRLSFGNYNKSFLPNRTDFDWLSRDNSEVDKYINDPFCGSVSSAGLFYDLLKGIKKISKKSNFLKIPKDLPMLLISGEKDPVGNNTGGVIKVYNAYKKSGIRDISIKFYKDGRHESLNEINRSEVYRDVVEWLNSHLPGKTTE